jgi:hypothetical protein
VSTGSRRLYLFSSDQSPLYAQDILNVLAAPAKQRYTFRYADRYLDDGLADAWHQLQDTPILVIFSMQQRAQYMAPAFIPIRAGRVVRTSVEGESHFVDFELGGYASLAEPEKRDGKEQFSERVHTFADALRGVTRTPYEVSASLGEPLLDDALDADPDQTVLFGRIGRYLANANAFRNAHFLRVLGIKPTGRPDGKRLTVTSDDPTYKLRAGTTYDLELFHARPSAPSRPEPFTVDVDGVTLRTIGRAGFDVSSRYDLVTLRLVATDAGGLDDRDTVVDIAPGPGVQGPNVALPVRVQARRRRAFGLAGLQAVALFAVAVASTMENWATEARLGLAGVGALAAVALGLLGISVLKTPAMPSPAKETAPSSAPPAGAV